MGKNYLKIAGNVHLAYYIAAADKLGINYEIIVRSLLARFEYKGKHWFIANTVTPLTNSPSSTIAKRKYLTNLILERDGIPVPKQAKISDEKEAVAFFRKYKDIVIKPSQALGGHGVSILPDTEDEIRKAYNYARENSKSSSTTKVLAEEFVHGDHYRFLVAGDEVVGIVRRVPAKVTGDGKNSIKDLIEIANIERKRNLLKPIPIDNQTVNKLDYLNLKLDSVPEVGQDVEVRFHANLTAGGRTEECSREVHDYYKELCIKAVKSVGMDFGGVDLITPDISKEAKCGINEINYNPGLRPHYKVSKGEVVDVAEKIMKYIMEKNK